MVGPDSCCDKQDADRGEPEACPLHPAQPLTEHHPGQQHGDPGVERGQHDCQAEHAGPGGRDVADVRDDVDRARAGCRQRRVPPPAGLAAVAVELWGEAGCGKSHLLQAAVGQARAAGPSAICLCRAVPQAVQVGAVDDVEALDRTGQIDLFALYNRQRENGGVLLVSGTQSPVHLRLRDDLRTRLAWGLVYQVQALNDTEKSRALEQHALARGFTLPPDVTHYLLRHGRRDLPSLLAVLDALDAQCRREKRQPTVPLLKEVMGQKN